jgi:hypothetical protein
VRRHKADRRPDFAPGGLRAWTGGARGAVSRMKTTTMSRLGERDGQRATSQAMLQHRMHWH